MSDVQLAPAVSDDMERGKVVFDVPFTVDVLRYYAGWPFDDADLDEVVVGVELRAETLEEYLETKTVVVAL
jgi:hypothetical protein